MLAIIPLPRQQAQRMPLSRRQLPAALLSLASGVAASRAGAGGQTAVAPMVDSAGNTAGRRPVRVLSSTDARRVKPLIDDFERRHPGLRIEYIELGTVALYDAIRNQSPAATAARADVVWSSAMDLQIKLVNDGHALRHDSTHAQALPAWALWKGEAYGTTFEPVGLVYNRHLLGDADVPRTHSALAERLLAETPRFRGRVATYDIDRAGLGYLIAAQDAMAMPNYWDLVRAMGACAVQLHTSTQQMLEDVADGDTLLAFNVLGSYAEAFARGRSELGIVYPSDYTLVVSRVAFIAQRAPNPQGARAWLDHLLSAPGQRLLAEAGGLYAVRADAMAERSALSLQQKLGASARPVALGPGLLAHLDHSKRAAMLKRWRQTLGQNVALAMPATNASATAMPASPSAPEVMPAVRR